MRSLRFEMIRARRKSILFMDRHFSGESIDFRQVIAIIIPVFIDQVFLIGLNLINTAMVSSSGMAAVSAVNMVDSLNQFALNIFIALATGGTVVVAQYYGIKNSQMVSRASSGAITLVGIVSAVIAVLLLIFMSPLLYGLFGQAEPEVMSNAFIYMTGCCISYPAVAIVQAICGVLRGVSQARQSMLISLGMNLSYVVFNFIFINCLQMSVSGLAISVNISRYGAAIVAFLYLAKVNQVLHFRFRSLFRFDWNIQKKVLFIGFPFASEQLFFNGGKILTQIFIVELGTIPTAVNAISLSLMSFSQVGAAGLLYALVTVIGQCVGRRNIEDARKLTRSFLGLSIVSLFVIGGLIILFFPWVVQLFSPPSQEVIDQIFIMTMISIVPGIIIWPFSFVLPSALRAAGDSRYTSIVAMLSMWLFRIVMGYLMGIILHMGLAGFFIAMVAEWGVRAIIFIFRFHGKKWYQHRLID